MLQELHSVNTSIEPRNPLVTTRGIAVTITQYEWAFTACDNKKIFLKAQTEQIWNSVEMFINTFLKKSGSYHWYGLRISQHYWNRFLQWWFYTWPCCWKKTFLKAKDEQIPKTHAVKTLSLSFRQKMQNCRTWLRLNCGNSSDALFLSKGHG